MKYGKQSYKFTNKPRIISTATIVGKNEGDGRLGNCFDLVMDDDYYGEDTFEKAERKMFEYVLRRSADKISCEMSGIDILLGGDLLNQIISVSFAARAVQVPFLGLYGACSTMAESLAVGAMIIDGQNADKIACLTGTHFCSAERQYRYPLELGTQRPPTSQWTVTGAACSILGKCGDGVIVSGATIGKVIDYGVTDANNMGAAMAPSAMDTLLTHFADFKCLPQDYDLILTGDLGVLGGKLLRQLMQEKGMPLGDNYFDCGELIYEVDSSEFQGGSGCGCSAVVINSYIYKRLMDGELNKILFAATGALLSPIATQQGESIPSVSHAVVLQRS